MDGFELRGVDAPFRGVDVPLPGFLAAAFAALSAFRFCFANEDIGG